MKVIRVILYIIAGAVLAFGLFLLYSTLDDYRPREITTYEMSGEVDIIPDTSQLELMIWNLGYAGLDASMDFFYDGGEKMRPSEEEVRKNLEGIQLFLEEHQEKDFILLQEVDRRSKRSYKVDQYETISQQFRDHEASFAYNYKVDFVPIPLSEPMGRVESGLMTLSRFKPASVERHSFPGNYSWPMSLFMLDRCFLVHRIPVGKDKYLLVINTHNSAYDDGSLRQAQMEHMSEFLLTEYAKGNYVIVGGDWNQTPYGLEPELPEHNFDTISLTYIEKDYPAPGWNWSYDPTVPTNRRVPTPYSKESSLTTIIDCFLTSPNVRIESVRTVDLDFRYSDHQPVLLQVQLEL